MADQVIRDELIDLVLLGRPALASPHWPVWAAGELAHEDRFAGARGLGVVAAKLPGPWCLHRVATSRAGCPAAFG